MCAMGATGVKIFDETSSFHRFTNPRRNTSFYSLAVSYLIAIYRKLFILPVQLPSSFALFRGLPSKHKHENILSVLIL